MFNLFIDSVRSSPSSWQHAKTVDEVYKSLNSHVNILSIGFISNNPQIGIKIVEYMVLNNILPFKVMFHCVNCEERKDQFRMLLKTGKYVVVTPWKVLQKTS